MVDFIQISARNKRGVVEIYPKFIIGKTKDLMIKGSDFYAVWLEDRGLWSTDEQDVITLIDNELRKYAEEHKSRFEKDYIDILYMHDAESGTIDRWHKYVQKQMRDSYTDLDINLIFSDQKPKKTDYASKQLSYPLEAGSFDSYEQLISTLYDPDERRKIEWAIGAIVTGDSKKLQKFLVLYGPPGAGKSTILNVIQMLFEGYYAMFDAEVLGQANAAFAMEQFKSNPLVAISHDGDLSHIEQNTRINSLVSHEKMIVNEKHKSLYSVKFRSFLFLGTNKPVKITDAKSGIIRRLIDVIPSGRKLNKSTYNKIMKAIPFELGAIAYHCKEVYLENPSFYDDYKPVRMMSESNDFYNFIQDSYFIFEKEDGTTLKRAWELYNIYVAEAKVPYPMQMRIFKNELRNYFRNFEERVNVDGTWVRNYYSGFKKDILEEVTPKDESKETVATIIFEEQHSNLDDLCAECPAQYGTDAGIPKRKWDNVTTKLKDLDTAKLHYLKVPDNLIVIDFDLKDKDGNKSYERNLEEASKWPKTYAELSKSGGGIHLHYIYKGDPTKLSRLYADDVEIKVFTGNSSLRRKLSKCNNEPINTISSGLPMKKGESKLINFETINNEKALRTIIRKNLNKEYHPATKPSVDFIFKVLEDAYESGMHYDVRDLQPAIINFAAASTNQSDWCLKMVTKMHFQSKDFEEASEEIINQVDENIPFDEKPIAFFDCEVFPNLFLVNWKVIGKEKNVVRMINPKPEEIENLCNSYRLVGFNCRNYDNHICYACMLGYTNEQLYLLSQKIIKGDKNAKFKEAYNLSYTDIFDYAPEGISLKKWEIKLGIRHLELGLPWDKPVPEEMWEKVAEYCDNDVISTEAVWEATQASFIAREILVDLVEIMHGIKCNVNMSTNSLSTKIIFGNDKNPILNYPAAQEQLRREFPEYEFTTTIDPKTGLNVYANMFHGVDLGFGGYVYANPGMYGNVNVQDVAGMHPESLIQLNLLGDIPTQRFKTIRDLRLLIKHKDFETARTVFDGKLAKYFDDESKAKALSGALKIVVNSIYGLTSAKFDNPFADRANNANNIVALRGALMMKSLQDDLEAKGWRVVHIKTDSIKVADATPEIVEYIRAFGKKYGYTFETENEFDRICLVNNAVYIAKDKNDGSWHATGKEFQVPYVFKKCFTKEPIEFKDMCEAKEVKTAMYLKFDEDNVKFVGKVGEFCPIKENCGGAELIRENLKKDGTTGLDAVVGTKGYKWLESAEVLDKHKETDIDTSYYEEQVNEAIDEICKYGDYEWFISDDPYQPPVYIDGVPHYEDNPPF